MLTKIVTYKYQEINRKNKNYHDVAQITSETNLEELKALLGLYILAAVLKDNHLLSNIMFDTSFSGARYKETMSKFRFEFLTACLRFDDKTTRAERREITHCKINYKSSSYLTIDEQLVGFRGKCNFRMYTPNKPAKYGLKLVLLCDVATKYLVNAEPCFGKSTQTNGLPLADHFITVLTAPIHGTNRNLTMDNWFTNIPLAEKLLKRLYNLTILRTIVKLAPCCPINLKIIK
ncbi:uncharacterized protein [Diabrotica undecimpunctata]|uniref:uncharacterized protein n=1 Tax=Diabrotica undecimpunctata TaxID=50387 RepID=UPI003B63830D